MTVIPEKRRVNLIRYLRLVFFSHSYDK